MTPSAAIVAFDFGTNSFRWLARDAKGVELGRGREVVGIGRALATTGAIGDEDLDRACNLLTRWRPGAGDVPDTDNVAVAATHALRAATNGPLATAALATALGLPVRVIPGEEEAALTYRGACAAIDGPGAVLDIGGGSTELVWGTGGRPTASVSLPVGVVTLAARPDETLAAVVARAGDAVDSAWTQVYNDSLPPAKPPVSLSPLLSNCGTSSVLALLHDNGDRYDREEIDGRVLSVAWLASFVARHRRWRSVDWARLPFVGAARADLMGPGIGILRWFLERFRLDGWRNREAGLLEGLATVGQPTEEDLHVG